MGACRRLWMQQSSRWRRTAPKWFAMPPTAWWRMLLSKGGAGRKAAGAGRGAPRLGCAPERGIVEAEARGAAAGVGARVPSLYFADRDRREAVLCKLLMGLNYICRYEQQQSARKAWEPRQSGSSRRAASAAESERWRLAARDMALASSKDRIV
ncbi:hypothetical protein ZWY2020_010868 [Hordeum vulgare]|nr:hypothetical protein ZWY2020_010868 [Hordeum vulgare]